MATKNSPSIPKEGRDERSLPVTHGSLSARDFQTLYFLYTYRFASTRHLQLHLQLRTLVQAQRELSRLLKLGLVNRHYDATDRLSGRPAAYYLTPQGAGQLKSHDAASVLSATVLHRVYKNITASPGFIRRQMLIVDIWSHFELQSREADWAMTFFTSSDLVALNYMPPVLPDAYVVFASARNGLLTKARLLITLHTSPTPVFVVRRLLRSYYEYVTSGEFELRKGRPVPSYVIVCETEVAVMLLRRGIRDEVAALQSLDIDVAVAWLSTLHISAKLMAPLSRSLVDS